MKTNNINNSDILVVKKRHALRSLERQLENIDREIAEMEEEKSFIEDSMAKLEEEIDNLEEEVERAEILPMVEKSLNGEQPIKVSGYVLDILERYKNEMFLSLHEKRDLFNFLRKEYNYVY